MITVTATISTKDRYNTTLPLAINSIIHQNYKPDKLIIFDDGEQKDLREDSLYVNLLSHLQKSGIKWQIVFGEKKGQVYNHRKALQIAGTDWIWRMDDDEIAEHDVLEKLMKNIDDSVGAVGGLIIDPKNLEDRYQGPFPPNKIEDIFSSPNIQWFKSYEKESFEVDHLYSSFLFRVKAASNGYCMNLSPVGHREETIFTHEIKRQGWKLLVDPKAITWHYRNPEGGIRSYQDESMWENDENIFKEKIKLWNVNLDKSKIIILDSGLGDHIAFAMVLPEILKKYKNITLAACYPDVFEDFHINIISIADSKKLVNDFESHSVYIWMYNNKWKKSLIEAYKEMYL